MLLKLLKYVGLGLAGISILLILYLSVAIILSLTPTNPQAISCDQKKQIFVASNGVHLDLILPRGLVSSELMEQLNPPDWVSYLAFGWGDAEFYINTPTWNDLKLGTSFRALFTNSQSAVHVVWLPHRSSHWMTVPLCHQQLMLINHHIENTFELNPNNRFIEIQAAGYTSNDRFYQARGSFNFIQTCNNWVNRGLKAAHIKTSVWSPFDKGILYQLARTKEDSMKD